MAKLRASHRRISHHTGGPSVGLEGLLGFDQAPAGENAGAVAQVDGPLGEVGVNLATSRRFSI